LSKSWDFFIDKETARSKWDIVLYIYIEGVIWFRQGTRRLEMHAGYVVYPVKDDGKSKLIANDNLLLAA
jgi:hypothetical protein